MGDDAKDDDQKNLLLVAPGDHLWNFPQPDRRRLGDSLWPHADRRLAEPTDDELEAGKEECTGGGVGESLAEACAIDVALLEMPLSSDEVRDTIEQYKFFTALADNA